ncbi:MAG: response regulator transcription factor [Lachnospiraceae bacterium]|nr:response regulator transcription factor [Lachnospiraceae bacterium]
MRIVCCDDEAAQVALLHRYIDRYAEEKKITAEVMEYADCDTLWWDLQDGLDAGLLLLDIEIKAQDGPTPMSGIALAKKMREAKMPYPVCFVTGIRDHVFEGYDVDAIGYLLKPYEKEQIFKILDKAFALYRAPKRYVFLQAEKERVKVEADDILAVEAQAHDCIVHLKEGTAEQGQVLTVRQGFQRLCEEMDAALSCSGEAQAFLTRIHRSFAVNMKNILRVTKDACVAEGNRSFPVARGNRDAVMQAFIAANRPAEGEDA